jgi:hypothetical protein
MVIGRMKKAHGNTQKSMLSAYQQVVEESNKSADIH